MLDSAGRGKDKVIPFTFVFIPTAKVWFESIWFIFQHCRYIFPSCPAFLGGEGIVLALQFIELLWNKITDLNMK